LAFDGLSQRRPDVRVTHLRASSIYGPGMVLTTLLPALVARARRHEPLRLHGPRSYAQNFVHVGDVAELTAALILSDESPSVVNAFSDDTHELPSLAQLVRAGLGSSSSVLDNTNDADAPRPVFQNARAKQLHPTFRKLVDNLHQAA
jgi:nucleoside-diphosphate-sugar epimerase